MWSFYIFTVFFHNRIEPKTRAYSFCETVLKISHNCLSPGFINTPKSTRWGSQVLTFQNYCAKRSLRPSASQNHVCRPSVRPSVRSFVKKIITFCGWHVRGGHTSHSVSRRLNAALVFFERPDSPIRYRHVIFVNIDHFTAPKPLYGPSKCCLHFLQWHAFHSLSSVKRLWNKFWGL